MVPMLYSNTSSSSARRAVASWLGVGIKIATATWRVRAFPRFGGRSAVVASEVPVCGLSTDVGKRAASELGEGPGLAVVGSSAAGSVLVTGARLRSNRCNRRLARAVNGIFGGVAVPGGDLIFPFDNVRSSPGSIMTENGVTCSQGRGPFCGIVDPFVHRSHSLGFSPSKGAPIPAAPSCRMLSHRPVCILRNPNTTTIAIPNRPIARKANINGGDPFAPNRPFSLGPELPLPVVSWGS